MTRAVVPNRIALYLALVQLLFTLGWTVYALYLPRLAAQVGIPRGWVIAILMLDQAIFTVADFVTGIAADRMARLVGRVGTWMAALTALSCAAFVALPFVAGVGPRAMPLFLGATMVWAVTSSVLRAPPLMLLGKYAARPSVPWLSALVLLGYGTAGAVSPYLGVALRDLDARWPFVLAGGSLVLASLGLVAAERALARQASAAGEQASRAPGMVGGVVPLFVAAVVVLGIGYQLHVNLDSAPLFLRFATQADLEALLPVFWIGFNAMMLPASLLTRRWGGLAVMGGAGLLGAGAMLAAHAATGLDMLVAAQFLAGGAWGCILASAVAAALAIGESGAEGRVVGLMFSALAVATFARMAAVAGGLAADPTYAVLLRWIPSLCWALGGALLVVLTLRQRRRRPTAG